jgi:hypothetical protein
MTGLQDVVDPLDGLRTFKLRHDHRLCRASVRERITRLADVFRHLDEAERDVVDAHFHAKHEVLGVLGRQRAGRQHDTGNVDALVFAQHSSVDDGRLQFVPAHAVDPELDVTVIDEQRVAGTDDTRQVVCRRHASRLTDDVADDDRKRVCGLQLDRLMLGELAGTDLRTAQILHQRDMAAQAICGRADPRDRCRVRLVRPVREVQTEDIGAGDNQGADDIVGVACRPNRRDDLRVPHTLSVIHNSR